MTSSMSGSRGPTGTITGASSSGKNFREKIPSGYKAGALQQFTPEQLELFQQLFSHVGPESFLSRLAGGDQSQFAEMEAPALRQFSELQGGLASRFSGMGGGGNQLGLGARKSSGFQNTMTSAASNFAQELQAQRQGLQRQALMDLMGISTNLLGQRPYDRFLVEKQQKQGGLGGALGALGGGALGFFGSGGNPMLALQGAQMGYGIGSAF